MSMPHLKTSPIEEEFKKIKQMFETILNIVKHLIKDKEDELALMKQEGHIAIVRMQAAEQSLKELTTLAHDLTLYLADAGKPMDELYQKYEKLIVSLESNSEVVSSAGQLAGMADSAAQLALSALPGAQLLGPAIKLLMFGIKEARGAYLEKQADAKEKEVTKEMNECVRKVQNKAFETYMSMLKLIFKNHPIANNIHFNSYLTNLTSLHTHIQKNHVKAEEDLKAVHSDIHQFADVLCEYFQSHTKLSTRTENTMVESLKWILHQSHGCLDALHQKKHQVLHSSISALQEHKHETEQLRKLSGEEENLKLQAEDQFILPQDKLVIVLKMFKLAYQKKELIKKLEIGAASDAKEKSLPTSDILTYRTRDKDKLHHLRLDVLNARFAFLYSLLSDKTKEKTKELAKEMGLETAEAHAHSASSGVRADNLSSSVSSSSDSNINSGQATFQSLSYGKPQNLTHFRPKIQTPSPRRPGHRNILSAFTVSPTEGDDLENKLYMNQRRLVEKMNALGVLQSQMTSLEKASKEKGLSAEEKAILDSLPKQKQDLMDGIEAVKMEIQTLNAQKNLKEASLKTALSGGAVRGGRKPRGRVHNFSELPQEALPGLSPSGGSSDSPSSTPGSRPEQKTDFPSPARLLSPDPAGLPSPGPAGSLGFLSPMHSSRKRKVRKSLVLHATTEPLPLIVTDGSPNFIQGEVSPRSEDPLTLTPRHLRVVTDGTLEQQHSEQKNSGLPLPVVNEEHEGSAENAASTNHKSAPLVQQDEQQDTEQLTPSAAAVVDEEAEDGDKDKENPERVDSEPEGESGDEFDDDEAAAYAELSKSQGGSLPSKDRFFAATNRSQQQNPQDHQDDFDEDNNYVV